MFKEKDYFLGHSGTHIGNGIYKVDEPFSVLYSSGLPPMDEDWAIAVLLDSNSDNIVIKYFTNNGDYRRNLLQLVFDHNESVGREELYFYQSEGNIFDTCIYYHICEVE